MLASLPQEITEIILNNLHQDELLQLSQTNRYFRALTFPRLFSVISIDSSPKLFRKDTDSLKQYQELRGVFKLKDRFIRAVNISSVYCLKLFFKTLVDNPEYGKFIRVIHVENLPDIPDLDMVELLEATLKFMPRLEMFNWNHQYPIPMSLLENNHELTAVNGNITSDATTGFERYSLREAVVTTNRSLGQVEKLTLRSIDLNEMTTDLANLKSLTIENCTNEAHFLLNLDTNAPNLEELALSVDEQPCLPKIFSTLALKTLKLSILNHCNIIRVSQILKTLNPDLSRLEITNQLDRASFKILQGFHNLDYLHVSVLEKDIYELLSVLNHVKFLSLNILEATERRNCLIANEFWDCATMTDENQIKYTDFTLEYHRKMPYLKWLRFHGNDNTYIFECNHIDPIIYREGFHHYFESLVNTLI
ncbi:hypothetical protein Cantr_00040 [Candida viswanathii]|uniref:F-box domain-containing protein n=1 Tax=Candida viswanathii TaxID=5486 RepID=A0A367YFY3_9ASCO|nr:hypothetical protein Cantr_00040 [Candida viswanathii]